MDGDPSTARSDDLAKLLGLMTLSDGRLARDLGVSTATVRSWRTGRRSPSAENCRLLVESARSHALSILRLTRELGGEPAPLEVVSPPVMPAIGEVRRHKVSHGSRIASLRKELEETARLLRQGA
jgi:transcriptional regulator with XRE-family HTH domain